MVVVDCHHRLHLCRDRMKMSLPKKKFFFKGQKNKYFVSDYPTVTIILWSTQTFFLKVFGKLKSILRHF